MKMFVTIRFRTQKIVVVQFQILEEQMFEVIVNKEESRISNEI